MPSIEQLERALIKAHRAGDVPNARAIAAEITASMSRREQPMEMPMPMPATPEPPKAEPETGFMAGLRAGFEGLKGDIAAIGATAGIEGAEEYAKGQREKVSQIYRQPELSEAPVSYLTGLLGQSVPYMLAPIAAGFLAPEALGAAGAAAAATAVSAGQFTGSNISRNLEEGKAAKDVDVAKSVAAAVPQALLDTLSLRMVPGLGKMFGKADFTFWVNRIDEGRYEDTNRMWQDLSKDEYDLKINSGLTVKQEGDLCFNLMKIHCWKAPTTLMLGRYQPWHAGHRALYEEAKKRGNQVVIGVRDTGGVSDKDPFEYAKVKELILEDLPDAFVTMMPNITNIVYGRDVGYKIEKVELGADIEAISATEIRKNMESK